MPAWIVDKANIDLLVTAFFTYEVPIATPITPDALGTMLWRENIRSVNYRYGRHHRTPRYRHETMRMVYGHGLLPSVPLGTIETLVRKSISVLKQLHCYRYQSCKRNDWERSQACAYTAQLEHAILTPLRLTTDQSYDVPAYDAWPWFIAYA